MSTDLRSKVIENHLCIHKEGEGRERGKRERDLAHTVASENGFLQCCKKEFQKAYV